MGEREAWNGARFEPADAGGHYESWFQRANHPTRREAFWIRYTVFSPAGRPEDAVGVIEKMIERDPAKRYDKLDDIIEDLAILEDE